MYIGRQKGLTQEWLSILIWDFQEMIREMINWPKRQYLHATTTTSTIITTTTITKTYATTAIKLLQLLLQLQQLVRLRVLWKGRQKRTSTIFLEQLNVSRWNFWASWKHFSKTKRQYAHATTAVDTAAATTTNTTLTLQLVLLLPKLLR